MLVGQIVTDHGRTVELVLALQGWCLFGIVVFPPAARRGLRAFPPLKKSPLLGEEQGPLRLAQLENIPDLVTGQIDAVNPVGVFPDETNLHRSDCDRKDHALCVVSPGATPTAAIPTG